MSSEGYALLPTEKTSCTELIDWHTAFSSAWPPFTVMLLNDTSNSVILTLFIRAFASWSACASSSLQPDTTMPGEEISVRMVCGGDTKRSATSSAVDGRAAADGRERTRDGPVALHHLAEVGEVGGGHVDTAKEQRVEAELLALAVGELLCGVHQRGDR